MKPMNIKLNDVQSQWAEIKEDCLPEIHSYLDEGIYVGSSYIQRFEEEWSRCVNIPNSILVSSGTSAYQLCLQALNLYTKDTCVLLQNNTWASILFITKQLGYKYDIIDCDEYLQYSVERLEAWLENNRNLYENIILVPTHILGHSCDMLSIKKLADRYNCKIIEDCSQSHGAINTLSSIGQHSDISFWSLYPGKNLGATGEAGIVSTYSNSLSLYVRALANCGMKSKNEFLVEGGNHRPDGVSSIVLYHKLKRLNDWTDRRINNANVYNAYFNIEYAPYSIKHVFHYFYFFTHSRDKLLKHLDYANIPYTVNYPFTLSKLENMPGQFSNSTVQSKEIVCLPCHQYMSIGQLIFIMEEIKKWR